MSEKKSEKLYKALKDVDPAKAPGIVNKYNQLMNGLDAALTNRDSKNAQQAKDHLEVIADDLIYQERRADLIQPFEQELDNIAESLGIAISIPTDIKVANERAPGFAERNKESELKAIFDRYSANEWKGIIDTMVKEGAEDLQIPSKVQYRVEQLNAIIMMLEAVKGKIVEKRGLGEKFLQGYEIAGHTYDRVRKITHIVDEINRVGIMEIVQNGLTVEQLFAKYNKEFGAQVRDVLRSHSGSEVFLYKHGRIDDVADESKKKEYYLNLVKFLREQSDYQSAQAVLEEAMADEFQMAIDFIPGDPQSSDKSEDNVKAKLFDQADAKVGKLVTTEVIAQWREKQGMNRGQIEDAKARLRDMHYDRLLHQYAAEHIIIGKLDDAESGQKSLEIPSGKKAYWEQYSEMLDPKGEAFNLTDESWDMVIEELVFTAPMILVSGAVAEVVVKGLSYAARAALSATRMAAWGGRLAEGGRMGRAAYRMGKLSASGTKMLVGGASFELTFQGLQEKLIFDQEDWVKSILWTSAALGLFRGAGKLGEGGAAAFNKALVEFVPKLADKKLVQLINKLVIVGHTQVAAMLLLGGVQHLSEGEFQVFWDNFGYQIFHAYVSIGSLNVAGGVISTAGGKIFKSKNRRPELKIVEGEVKDQPAKRARGMSVAAKVAEAIRGNQSQSVEVGVVNDLVKALETLHGEGFEFKINENGETVASKGGIEIHLKEVGSLKKAMTALKASAEKLGKLVTDNPKGLNQRGFKSYMDGLQNLYNQARGLGFSKMNALAIVMSLNLGCESFEKGGKGIEGGTTFLMGYGLPIGGLLLGISLLIGGTHSFHRGLRIAGAMGHMDVVGSGITEARNNNDATPSVVAAGRAIRQVIRHVSGPTRNALREIASIADELEILVNNREVFGMERGDQLRDLNTRFRTEYNRVEVPEHNWWSIGIALSGALLFIGTAIAWLYSANKDKSDEDDENNDLQNIPIFNGGGGGTQDVEDTESTNESDEDDNAGTSVIIPRKKARPKQDAENTETEEVGTEEKVNETTGTTGVDGATTGGKESDEETYKPLKPRRQ